jgi:hypothetical protein
MKTTTRQLKTTSTGTNMFIFLHENRDFWDKQVPTITISILILRLARLGFILIFFNKI